MAEYLDKTGLAYLWSKIKANINSTVSNHDLVVTSKNVTTVSDDHFKTVNCRGLLYGKVAVINIEAELQTGIDAHQTIICCALPWSSNNAIYAYTTVVGLDKHSMAWFKIVRGSVEFCTFGTSGAVADTYSATLVYMIP